MLDTSRRKRMAGWMAVGLSVAVGFFLLTRDVARSQSLDALSALQALQNQQSIQQQGGATQPGAQVIQPATPGDGRQPMSRLERLYSERAGVQLSQFGYETLGVPTAVQVAQAGAIQDNYVLGSGDEIIVVLRGQENSTYRQRVNRDGQLILPKLRPVQASGRAFGEFRSDLEDQIRQAFISTNASISLGEVRQVSVLVAGEVRNPGVRVVSGLSSPLDAILLSGGVGKTGSLRNITVQSGDRTRTVDLYSVLTRASASALGTLRDGDRIYVPSLQNTVAITGRVQKPGIYELPRGTTSLAAAQLLELAGGVVIPGSYQMTRLNLGADGASAIVASSGTDRVRNGEVLFVDPGREGVSGRITLGGALQVTGTRSIGAGATVGSFVHGSADLASNAYAMFAVIIRRDAVSNVKTLVPFSLESVFRGQGDVTLRDGDAVYAFTMDEVRLLSKAASGGGLTPEELGCSFSDRLKAGPQQSQTVTRQQSLSSSSQSTIIAGCPQLDAQTLQLLNLSVASSGAADSVAAVRQSQAAANGATEAPASPASQAAPSAAPPGVTLFNDLTRSENARADRSGAVIGSYISNRSTPSLRGMSEVLDVSMTALVLTAKDHLVWVLDAVRDPGAYLSADGSTLISMIRAAGGLSRQADLSSVEVTSTDIDTVNGTSRTLRAAYKGTEADFQKVAIRPLDVIRLRPVFSDAQPGRITVLGEVRYPGTFDIVRGEKLSSIIERAGGLTDQAYPYGAVFTRQRAAEEERLGNARLAKQLESDFATLISMPSYSAAALGASTYVANYTNQLRTQPALGRISVTADPGTLRANPDLDMVVEGGDTLIIPPRPTTVTVSGEVLNPGSFQYRSDLSLSDYLTLSGGVSQSADEGRVFIVMPDGTARPASRSWLTFSANTIPPGATIVVPRDLRPFDTMQFFKDFSQISSQVAITAASLAVIGR